LAQAAIQRRLDKLAGPIYRQEVGIAFVEPEFTRIVGALRALIGDVVPLEMAENGLGLNNLLYMATLLAGVSEERQDGLSMLLVEEPEAHLHPQLQDLLMDYLSSGLADGVQVIATSHSPNFASSAGVDRITIQARTSAGAPVVSTPLFSLELKQHDRLHLRRFLDVTKSALLFARGVLLVEGLAEQLLFPDLARALGISLKEAGVAVVGVGGLSFRPFAELFGPGRLPYRCAIVSDADPPNEEGEEKDEGDGALSVTAKSLIPLQNDNLRLFLSENTLEWDIVKAGNWDLCLEALKIIHPVTAKRLRRDHDTSNPVDQADALLAKVVGKKGPFAQAMVQVLAQGAVVKVPAYIASALDWVRVSGPISPTGQLGDGGIQEALDVAG
jgi:putative ATP-dependent endonuclease of OLD family